mgnify:CR=1 FL=1
MNSYKVILLLFLSTFAINSFSQESNKSLFIEGVVSDSGNALPFATVYNHSDKSATITNHEGYFELEISSWSDTVLVSYVGYKTKKINFSENRNKYNIELKAASVDIRTVTVFPKDYTSIYNLLESCKNKRSRKKKESKSYYQLKSYIDNQQIELVEAFFNATVYGYDLLDMKLKCGRVGLRKKEKSFFGSLETSKSINHHKLFFSSQNFPASPLEFNAKRMKRKFYLELEETYLDENQDSIFVVYLFPKKNKDEMFFCRAWINATDTSLLKVELQGSDLDIFPFMPIYEDDYLSSKNLTMTKTFKTIDEESFFEQIYFEYDFNYHKNGENGYRVKTEAILYNYDFQTPFFIPFYGFKSKGLTDYQMLGAIPYNQFFWEYNDELKLNEKYGLNQAFMNDSNTVTNYNYLEKQSSLNQLFSYPLYQWSNKRFGFKEFPKQTAYIEGEPDYQLFGGIFLDYNHYEDSINLLTASVFDAYTSYYRYYITPAANCFFNIYFDLIESRRRKFERVVKEETMSEKELKAFYEMQSEQLMEELKTYELEVERGRNSEKFRVWNHEILNNLSIDNISIFQLEQRD